MHIRTAGGSDAEAIAQVHIASMREIYRTLFPEENGVRLDLSDRTRRWREHLAGAESTTLIAEEEGVAIGFSDFGPCRDEPAPAGTLGEILSVYVHPSVWGQGVGSSLLRESLNRLREEGFREVMLWVLEENEQALRFYQHFGFRSDGVPREQERNGRPSRAARLRLQLTSPEGE